MIQTNHATGFSSSYIPASKTGLRQSAPTLRFASLAPEAPGHVREFQDVLERSDGLQDYKVNLAAAYPELSERAQRYVDKLTTYRIRPEEVEAFHQQKRLGYIEEGSDLFYEYFVSQSAHLGVITKEDTERWGEQVEQAQKQKVPFAQTYAKLRADLPQDKVKAFQQATGLSPKEARNFLGLIAMQMALFEKRDFQNRGPAVEGRVKMRSEALELVRHGKPNWGKFKMLALSTLYGWVPVLPGQYLLDSTRQYVTEQLGVPVKQGDLRKNVFLKQLGRQELDYNHRGWNTPRHYKQRKTITKPFEELIEASILKDCLNRANVSIADAAAVADSSQSAAGARFKGWRPSISSASA